MANEVIINVKANTDKANQALSGFKQKMDKVAGAARVGGLALSAFGAAGVLAIKGFVNASQVQERAVSVLAQTVENTGTSFDTVRGKIMATTAALQKKTNFGDEEQIKALSLMVPILGDVDLAMEVLPAIMDASAASGKKLETVSRTLTRAISGQVDTAISIGMEFEKDATVSERLAAVLGKVGGAAEADVDPFIQLGNAVGDMKEIIGKHLLPVIMPLITFLGNLVEKISNMNPKFLKFMAIGLAVATAIAAIGGPMLLIIGMLPLLAGGFSMVGAAITFMFGPIGIIIAAIAGLAIAWATNLGDIREKTKKVFGFIMDAFHSKLGWLLPGGVFVKALFYVKDNWDAIWDGIVKGFVSTVDVIIGLVNKIIRALNSIKFEIPKIMFGETVLFGGFKFGGLNIPEIALTGEVLKNKIGEVVEVAMELPDKIKSGVGSMFEMGEETDKTKNAVSDLSNEIDKMNQKIAESAIAATGGVDGGMGGGMGGGGIPSISGIGNVNPFHEFMTQAEIAAGTWRGSLQYLRDRAAGMTSEQAREKYWGLPYTDPETGEVFEFGRESPYRGHSRTTFSPDGAVTQAKMSPEAYLAFQIHLDGIEISKNQGDIENAQAGMTDE